MSGKAQDVTLIGVDGGASRVRAYEVLADYGPDVVGLRLGEMSAERTYPPAPFTPVSASVQREQYAARAVSPTSEERDRGQTIGDTIAECVIEVARQAATAGRAESGRVLLGIGMPGLKTDDGRGIAVMNNGPRICDLAEQIEEKLSAAGVALTGPIKRLGSDGDYCGLGEQHAVEGQFRNVDNAYYVGGGTGLAEALKLGGKLRPFDEGRAWIAKAWEIRSTEGLTFEQLVSAAGINCRYLELAQVQSQTLAADASDSEPPAQLARICPPFPEERAVQGDPIARHVLATAAAASAELIFERIETVYRGRQSAANRGTRYAELSPAHRFRGLLLERVVLGQQLGRLFDNSAYYAVFGARVETRLVELLIAEQDAVLTRWYLQTDRLRPGLLVVSRLPAAAALGAVADALS